MLFVYESDLNAEYIHNGNRRGHMKLVTSTKINERKRTRRGRGWVDEEEERNRKWNGNQAKPCASEIVRFIVKCDIRG